MSRRITQRELRNETAESCGPWTRGRRSSSTPNGVAVGELIPLRQRVFVPTELRVRRRATRGARAVSQDIRPDLFIAATRSGRPALFYLMHTARPV